MRRTLFAVSLTLALLAGLPPGNAVAGPPEGVSERMVLDEVAEGLRDYRQERDPEKRLAWLKRLAPTKDPRVAVALAAADDDVAETSALLSRYYLSRPPTDELRPIVEATFWCHENEADLRPRAKEPPR
jgi:hypothetical protein